MFRKWKSKSPADDDSNKKSKNTHSKAYKIVGEGVAVLKPQQLKNDQDFKAYVRAMRDRKIGESGA